MTQKTFFILTHGLSTSSTSTTNVIPKGVKLIHTSRHGYMLQPDAVAEMVQNFSTHEKVKRFIAGAKPPRFVVREKGDKYVDTSLLFQDAQAFMGVIELPTNRFERYGISKSPSDSTEREPTRMSQIIEKYGEGTYIFATCRGVGSIPTGHIVRNGIIAPRGLTVAQRERIRVLQNLEGAGILGKRERSELQTSIRKKTTNVGNKKRAKTSAMMNWTQTLQSPQNMNINSPRRR